MMKVPLMITPLVVLALLEESRVGAIDISDIDAAAWCTQNVPQSQPSRNEVINSCKSIIDSVPPEERYVCELLYYWYIKASDPGPYFEATGIVYDGLCNEVSTPEGPLESQEDCGKSDSLRSTTRRMWSGVGRIVGGTDVRDCSVIPWQVRLRVSVYTCGGSILSDRHILTAAHCIEILSSLNQVEVYLADHRRDQLGTHEETRTIKNMTMHENYNTHTWESDIAILTLQDPIVFDNPCVAKICRDPYFDYDGQFCTVSGWGTLSEDGQGANVLQMVHVKAHEGWSCIREFGVDYSGYVRNKQQMMCAGHIAGGKDSCQGDSGGPLVCLNSRTNSFVQVGVASYGRGCGRPNFPGVYADVAYFNDWIDRIMAENP